MEVHALIIATVKHYAPNNEYALNKEISVFLRMDGVSNNKPTGKCNHSRWPEANVGQHAVSVGTGLLSAPDVNSTDNNRS